MGRMTSEPDLPAGPETIETVPPPEIAERPAAAVEHRQPPRSEGFKRFIASGWAARPDGLPGRSDGAVWAERRRQKLSEQFPGERLVLPAGRLRTRSNDTDYRFRPHSAFAHLTGLGTDRSRTPCSCSRPARPTEGAAATTPCSSSRPRPGATARGSTPAPPTASR